MDCNICFQINFVILERIYKKVIESTLKLTILLKGNVNVGYHHNYFYDGKTRSFLKIH